MGLGAVTGIAGLFGARKAKKELKNLLANAPKYKIAEEAFQNQDIAKAEAFGKDRDVQMAKEDIDADVAKATGEAKDITTSTSALLSALTDIESSAFGAKRDLGQYEAGTLRRQKIGALYGANQAMIDEKDKEWNYNENMPYQMKVASARDREKFNREMMMRGAESEANAHNSRVQAAGQMFGAVGGMLSDKRVKTDIKPTAYNGLNEINQLEVVEFKYGTEIFEDPDKNFVGLIAQDTEKVIPEAVRISGFNIPDSEEKLKMIDYNQIVPVLIKAVQELSKQVEELKKEKEMTIQHL